MEPFSLLKFWKTAGSNADSIHNATNTTSVDVRSRAPETDEDSDSDSDDDNDGDSLFDLVLTRSSPDGSGKNVVILKPSEAEEDEDSIINLIAMESPFKAKVFAAVDSKPHSPIALLKSAPKFRVFFLGLRKPKSNTNHVGVSKPKHCQKPSWEFHGAKRKGKPFTLNSCNVGDFPIGSSFSRDNSLRSKMQRERFADFSKDHESSPKSPPALSKDNVPAYLKLIKPLYIRASRRYTTGSETVPNWYQLSAVSPSSSPATASEDRRVSRGAVGFRVVSKHLGKSRSAASSTVGVTSSPASRRDDSLLLQHDGIQSAILHCKRSYNSSAAATDCSGIMRAPHGNSVNEGMDLNLSGSRCSTI